MKKKAAPEKTPEAKLTDTIVGFQVIIDTFTREKPEHSFQNWFLRISHAISKGRLTLDADGNLTDLRAFVAWAIEMKAPLTDECRRWAITEGLLVESQNVYAAMLANNPAYTAARAAVHSPTAHAAPATPAPSINYATNARDKREMQFGTAKRPDHF